MSCLRYKAIKGFKLKDLANSFQKKAFVRSPFLAIQSREDKPVGHGSAISASISSHAEHFISAFKARALLNIQSIP